MCEMVIKQCATQVLGNTAENLAGKKKYGDFKI